MAARRRVIEVAERRARLARRHRLAPGDRAADVEAAAASVVCLHGTDPATIHLSAWARVDGMAVTDLERALYGDRSLVKHMAMRRTLFVFPRETMDAAQAGATERVADAERRRLVRDVERAGLHDDGERRARRALAARVRARHAGRHQVVARVDRRGRAPGPGRPRGGRGRSRRRQGYLLPDDLEPTDPVEPWAALLPPLDPTTMGWFERDWYLGSHRAQLFDINGNAGATVWWDGRIVGGWRQGDAGEVVLQLLEDVGSEGLRAAEREAARLTEWFDGTRALPRFPSPLSKADAVSGR